MSIEKANKARFERGLMALTELEGELLEALERVSPFMAGVTDSGPQWDRYQSDGVSIIISKAENAISKAYGHG